MDGIARYEADSGIIPVPIRRDCTVRIHGLPADLTTAEAEKVAAVVKAYTVSPTSRHRHHPSRE